MGRRHPGADWVVGDAFDPTLAPGGRFDARWLDGVVADRPVVLHTMDHHTMWVNSETLRRVGYDARTPEPDAGQILRRADGSPLGTLREWGAIGLVLDLLPVPGLSEQAAVLAEVSALFAAAGITWVEDAWVDHGQVDAWLAAAAPARCGSAPTWRSGPSRPRGRTSSANSPRTATG